jgi:hypothetical protein
MTEIYIAVLTILLGGVVSGMVTHRLETSRARQELRRQKLEQLYTAVHGFSTMLIQMPMAYSQVMAGKIDYNQGLDLLTDITKEKTGDHETAIMLVNIYFPELIKPLEAIFAQRDLCNAIQGNFRQEYERNGPGRYLINSI